MAQPKVPTVQLHAAEFCICAGSLLFRHVPNLQPQDPSSSSPRPLEVCILWHADRHEFLLPKGRKDRGESLETAALRETYEETGFPAVLLPVDMTTRAPESGVNTKDGVGLFVRACTEPFMVSQRNVAERNVKWIYWFVSRVDDAPRWPRDADGEVARVEGTQMDSEHYESQWFPVAEALTKLAFVTDRALLVIFQFVPYSKIRRPGE